MRQRLEIKRSDSHSNNRLLSTIRNYLPGAWIAPKNNELITLYRLRYRMALEEQKYDAALIFLNKILELDPLGDAEERRLSLVLEQRHHHQVEEARAAADDVEMPVRQRIERARIDGHAHWRRIAGALTLTTCEPTMR